MKKIIIFLTPLLLISTPAFALRNNDAKAIQIKKQDRNNENPPGPAKRSEGSSAKSVLSAEDSSHNKQAVQAKKQAMEKKCEKITARVQNRLNQYQTNEDKYHNRYQGIKKRISNLADHLEDKGCDTSQMRADLDSYEVLADDLQEAFKNFVSELKGTQEYACGESEGQFRNQIHAAQGELYKVKAAAKALKNFFRGTLKPHLQAMKAACGEQLQTQTQTGGAI